MTCVCVFVHGYVCPATRYFSRMSVQCVAGQAYPCTQVTCVAVCCSVLQDQHIHVQIHIHMSHVIQYIKYLTCHRYLSHMSHVIQYIYVPRPDAIKYTRSTLRETCHMSHITCEIFYMSHVACIFYGVRIFYMSVDLWRMTYSLRTYI